MKFKPLGARVLLRPVEREDATPSGIVLPDTAKREHQNAESSPRVPTRTSRLKHETWWYTASTREPRSTRKGRTTWW